jgi:hypothetical protein
MLQATNLKAETNQTPLEPEYFGDAQDAVIVPKLTVTIIVGKDDESGRSAGQAEVKGTLDSRGDTMGYAAQAFGRAAFQSLDHVFDELIDSAKEDDHFPQKDPEGYATLVAVAGKDFAQKFGDQFQAGFSAALSGYLEKKLGVTETTSLLLNILKNL